MAEKVDLRTEFAGLRFKNPITVASGTFGIKDEYAQLVDYSRLGAIITKTITCQPRQGNPMPRIWETPSGMLNSIGLENKGLDNFIKSCLPFFKELDTHLIVSIAGENIDEYVLLAQRLEKAGGVSALEINISCPNVEKGSLEFGAKAELTYELIHKIRNSTDLVLITKLSPETRDFLAVASAAQEAGSEVLSLINTIKGLAIDIEKRKSRLAKGLGGLSGPAIRPIALRYLYEVKQNLEVPVIAMGGIMNLSDALEFFITGADMIAIGTANFVNPCTSIEILEGLEKYLKEQDLSSIGQLRGSLQIDTQE